MITIGKLIENERKKGKISQRELAKGICSYQMIGRIEGDECDANKFLFDILIERLGKCPDSLEYIVSQDEYRKIVERDTIEDAILTGQREYAEELLEGYRLRYKETNHVQQMYYHRTKAYIHVRCQKDEKDLQAALEHIVKAIEYTMPFFCISQISANLFSVWEMENILAYAKILFLTGEPKHKETAHLILENCYTAIKNGNICEEMKSKLLPKCVYLMTCFCKSDTDKNVLAIRCEEAIELLRDYSVLYLMVPLLKNTVFLYRELGQDERADYWNRYYEALTELYETYSKGMVMDSLFFHWYQCLYYLDYEVLRGERLNREVSQEELIENIFSNPASLSNSENGKSSPNKKKFDSLMQKLEINKTRYSGVAATNSFEELEWIQELRRKVGKREYQCVLDTILQKNTEDCSRDIVILMEVYRSIAEFHLNGQKSEARKEELRKALAESFPLDSERYYRIPFLWESDLLNTYLGREWKDYNREYVVQTLKKVMDVFLSSGIHVRHCYRTYAYALGDYVIFEGRTDIFHDSKERFEEGICYSLECGKGSLLSSLYWGIATSKVMSSSNKSPLFYYSYLFAELYKDLSADLRKYYYEKSLL